MKVFTSSDMEGTAGVVDWGQCLLGQPEYEHYRGLLQAEVNAAIEGAVSAGAEEFFVNDSHSKMQNLRPAELAGNARYLFRSAVVKTAVTRFAADSMHPVAACELIRTEAAAAVRTVDKIGPPQIELPATLDVTFRNADVAEMATWITGVQRTGNCTVSITGDDPIRLSRTFITTVLLTRDIAE